MWNPANSADQTGQVAARMETTPSLGSASISVSQQQAPKKFAPMVAPKPKFNPYKQMGEALHSEPADYPPPPPAEDSAGLPPSAGSFPPPPAMNSYDYQAGRRPSRDLRPLRSHSQPRLLTSDVNPVTALRSFVRG